MRRKLTFALMLSALLAANSAQAQLSKNPDKFLGNITTHGSTSSGNTNGIEYYTLWNQITGENESKWGSVEGSKGNYNWSGSDNCANYAKNHKFPFKFHAIIWGAQHPNWFNGDLSVLDRKKAIYNWMDAMKAHYKTIDLIDVANECIDGHQPDTYLFVDPLGGTGESGWDWLVNAFKRAHELWPEAILIYNDFNTFRWQKSQYIDLVRQLRDAGAPIDAYGCQSHDLTDMEIGEFKNAMTEIQNALKMPMYSSEYDIGTDDDQLQLNRYKNQIPYMWESDYVAGITLWGWIYGKTWTTNGNSGLIRDGKDRPAMTWLREYMAKPETATTPSPFPGMKKPISLYIQPKYYKAPINEPCPINIEATTHNGSKVEKVEFFVNNKLEATLTEAPFVYDYTPTSTSKVNLKAIAYTNDGKTYERLGALVGNKWSRHPYTADNEPLTVPGILEAEDFDMGGEGISYHSARTATSATKYRDDQEKVGIYPVSEGGYAIDQSVAGEWFDYTLDFTKSGKINCEALVTNTENSESEFTIFIYRDGDLKAQKVVTVPVTGRKKFALTSFDLGMRMSKGVYKIRVYFNKAKVGIDRMYIGMTAADAIDEITSQSAQTFSVYTVSGILTGTIEADDITDAVRNLHSTATQSGIYIIKNNATGESKKVSVK